MSSCGYLDADIEALSLRQYILYVYVMILKVTFVGDSHVLGRHFVLWFYSQEIRLVYRKVTAKNIFLQSLQCFAFNEFASTVKFKCNSTWILGLILICLSFTTGHFKYVHYSEKHINYLKINSWLNFQRLIQQSQYLIFVPHLSILLWRFN